MKIGLIDVDSHNYVNLPLMKLSAFHKRNGDSVEWYYPLISGHMDIVYQSKVFTFTADYDFPIDTDKLVKGGTGYLLNTVLEDEIEHIYPDYSIYPSLTKDTAYGFLTRGCPRGCDFCIVGDKEGRKSRKVADLSEFWSGQCNIVLMDPNLIACAEWKDLIQQLIDSKSYIDINQGIDIRLMTEEKAEMIKRLKVKNIHFAWDRIEDKSSIIDKFKMFKDISGLDYQKLTVFVLTNFNTTTDEDLERIYTLRDIGYNPYVMIYEKEKTKSADTCRMVQRWVNNRRIFRTIADFKEYRRSVKG